VGTLFADLYSTLNIHFLVNKTTLKLIEDALRAG
jgi:hypothetical protein